MWEPLQVLSCPSQFRAALSKPVASLGLSLSEASYIPAGVSLYTFSADAHGLSSQIVGGERIDQNFPESEAQTGGRLARRRCC